LLRRMHHGFLPDPRLLADRPVDIHRFMSSREPALAELAARFLLTANLTDRLNFGRQFADLLFKDVPNPARID
ncbi:MAG: hypothetical protein AAB047_00035, partial [Nitrospirota bacterium]